MPKRVFDVYFLVSFKSDTIITWGKKEDMHQHQNEFIHLDLQVIAFQNLTKKMKDSISLYTNGLLN